MSDDYSDLPDESGPSWTSGDRRRVALAAIASVALLGLIWFEASRGGGSAEPAEQGPVAAWPASEEAQDDIPHDLLLTYEEAATTCPGLPWPVIAAIGKAETDHGRETETSTVGAEGPMQFLPATWIEYQADGDGDGVADVFDPEDAIYGAARLLCANGGESPDGLREAIYTYNRSDSYVDRVLEVARSYTDAEVEAD